jgi:hypothetical protein
MMMPRLGNSGSIRRPFRIKQFGDSEFRIQGFRMQGTGQDGRLPIQRGLPCLLTNKR